LFRDPNADAASSDGCEAIDLSDNADLVLDAGLVHWEDRDGQQNAGL
jgi:hypothetical protein